MSSSPDQIAEPPRLFFREMGKGHPLLILHGLLGSLNNWQSIARELSGNFRVILADQRNHGRSFHSPDHTYPLLANDIRVLMDSLSVQTAFLLGHSMGGKAVMTFAARFPDRVDRLVVVDIAPRAYKSAQEHLVDDLLRVDLSEVTERADVDHRLKNTVEDLRLRQFLLTNLKRNDDGRFSWKANIRALRNNRHELTKGVEFPHPCQVPALFIRGGQSSYIDRSDLPHIHRVFKAATVKTIANAGHWVHADMPNAVVQMVREFLQN
jgi:pimeloyl-ACP methyl ester carboxylesterase